MKKLRNCPSRYFSPKIPRYLSSTTSHLKSNSIQTRRDRSITTMWLSDFGNRVGNGLKRSLASDSRKINRHGFRHDKPPILGILAFETAKTMSRLVSLYKSLSDEEIFKLRKEIMRSEGVAYLNSKDEGFLLDLACAERIEDLDLAAVTVDRLGKKCSDFGLTIFHQVYADLKLGSIDLGKLEFATKEVEKIIEKMEKFISATSNLYLGLEALLEMEVSERKLKQWQKNSRPIQSQKANSDMFDQKLAWQRQQVQHFRDVSLWNQTFDKSVDLMARLVCIVYARICVVFGPYISVLPRVSSRNAKFHTQHMQVHHHSCPLLEKTVKDVLIISKSGPIPNSSKPGLIRFWSRDLNPTLPAGIGFGVGFGIGIKENQSFCCCEVGKRKRLSQAASPNTVGGSGLTLRYANVIILAERYLKSACPIGEDAREDLFQMLPASLKKLVRSKLRNNWRKEEDVSGVWNDESLAEGWRDALKGILEWLAPMAHDSVRWQTERSLEKQKFDAKPMVLLLQTLHFSDREKTEAAIAEVLVGLSCILRYQNRRSCDGDRNR
ncbi:hypothetical protein HHK36_018445 [Tetracentron sinense]|uniref:Uncharacterized protein n=1 Tax=Tetracentron sinense TaxID=13715 RepID=A0A835DDJ7_TETSI|nr:hypothetical protein HHK36_018445 [Tetracentron sinense]